MPQETLEFTMPTKAQAYAAAMGAVTRMVGASRAEGGSVLSASVSVVAEGDGWKAVVQVVIQDRPSAEEKPETGEKVKAEEDTYHEEEDRIRAERERHDHLVEDMMFDAEVLGGHLAAFQGWHEEEPGGLGAAVFLHPDMMFHYAARENTGQYNRPLHITPVMHGPVEELRLAA